jgi:hypothetical protein
MMYEWSAAQKDILLITGHTHQPVFESLTHLERLHRKEAMERAAEDSTVQKNPAKLLSIDFFSKIKPTYFNTGCCCYDDGDITGIEIAGGNICLIKWEEKNGIPERTELEKTSLEELTERLG